MTPEEIAAQEEAERAAQEEAEEKSKAAPSQDKKRTEAEKAAFTLKKNAERVRELGLDPNEVLGIKPSIKVDEALDDDKPLTVGDLRKIQKQEARATAEDMANKIEDEHERAKVKDELKFIVPSGNAEEDLRRARATANAPRNAQIVEEALRRTAPRTTASGASQDTPAQEHITLTPQEEMFTRPPYNLSVEKIIAKRTK